MNILICPDKFKGSLTAKEVCHAVSEGFLKINPSTQIQSVPLADGGEGTCALLTEWHEGTIIELQVHGPLFTPVTAQYGISRDGEAAFIEIATASGLVLIKPEDQDPLVTTTLGTGELIADALKRNVKNIILGLGGSATNDAGIGMAAALGYQFCDADGRILKPTGENLVHIHQIKTDSLHPLLRDTRFVSLCDVTNPLYGPEGAAYVYGPQKGADKPAIELLDAGLRNFGKMASKYLKQSVDFPGAGAAGGLGAGCKIFLNATIEKGIHYMIRNTRLLEKISGTDLIVTGEGRIDSQTFSGKVVSEVTRLAREAGKPVIAVCGKCELTDEEISSRGIQKVISLVGDETSPETAMRDASALLSEKVWRVAKGLPGF